MPIPSAHVRPIRLVVLFAIAVLVTIPAANAQAIPTDVKTTCTATSQQFASWFQSGTPSLDGAVKPADSANFVESENCDFYRWAQQMFLWVTSPAGSCGSGAHVFDTPVFFDVSNEHNSQRTFIAHTCSPERIFPRPLTVHSSQLGPHKLPVILDKRGRMFEVETPAKGPHGKPLLYSSAGTAVEVERVELGKEKEPIFLDKNGKRILNARPILQIHLPPKPSNDIPVVQKFMIGRNHFFVDPYGSLVETKPGQAESAGVLMAQTGSLVYYAILTNDVYAYFRTVTPSGGGAVAFPSSAAMLAPATALAAQHGVSFSDPNALVTELKTSWVEASSLPNADTYITSVATIPTYDTSNPNQWTPNGTKRVRMALVGMNLVGSVNGHSEMVWATFEHFGNTPLNRYTYRTANGDRSVGPTTSGTWLFAATPASGPSNCKLMVQQGDNIVPNPDTDTNCSAAGFKPSNTLRELPWGSFDLGPPNPDGTTAIDTNTDILSINNSIHGMLLPDDVRANYYLAGATWTYGGLAPNSSLGLQAGTHFLSNSTIETYYQGLNCLSCHTSGSLPNVLFGPPTTDISHIFSELQPLPFGTLVVHVSPLQTVPPPNHKITVTVTNSQTNTPVVGATVRIGASSLSSGSQVVSGTTSGAGTVTLTYPRCDVVTQGPTLNIVPCNGSVEAAGLGTKTFLAP